MAAPVHLPDGARVTNLLLAVLDNSPADATATLMRTGKSENADALVSANSGQVLKVL